MFFICSAGPPTTNSFECSLFDDSHCIATRARLQFNIRHYRSDIFYLVTGITVGRKWDFKWIAFHLAYERLLNLLIPYQALISPKGYVFGFTQRSHICFCMLDALDITEKRFLRRCSSHRQDVCGKARKPVENLYSSPNILPLQPWSIFRWWHHLVDVYSAAPIMNCMLVAFELFLSAVMVSRPLIAFKTSSGPE